MNIPNAYCRKHDEIEPQDYDSQNNGVWFCPTCSSKPNRKMLNNIKPLDVAIKAIEKKIKEGYYGKKS